MHAIMHNCYLLSIQYNVIIEREGEHLSVYGILCNRLTALVCVYNLKVVLTLYIPVYNIKLEAYKELD